MSAAMRIHVRTSGGEVEIEVGDPSSIDAAIDAATRIVQELASGAQVQVSGAQVQVAEGGSAVPDELPDVKVEKGDSLADVIKKMFDSSWGRRPRRLSEVMDALSSFGLIYPKSSVAVALLRLAKDGEIRRFKEGGEYVYIEREPAAGGDA
ncbi:hypothetical protein [Conexivisphaera calida]|uniref:Uncharacterized protein n=1 Tax=Conexivisphaera calida TaxID=1874277 RepID=A0A4P2VPW0_9ARCH|nr:hypothetical protein [Conexivisphaera calida]BBE42948.1 hypothetical protein NAS2_1571 [Conexivisphaera calida]